MPTLIYHPGQADERSFVIGREDFVIGRADDNAVAVRDRGLSRNHARIEADGGRFFVVDLQSKNGTFVNGAQVDRRELHNGDSILLGDCTFVFSAGDTVTARDGGGLLPRAVRPLTRIPIERLGRDTGGDTQRTRGRMRVLLEVAKLLSGRMDVDALLQRVLDLAFQMLDVDRGAVLLIDEQTGRVEPRVTRTRTPAREGEPIYSQRIVDYVLQNSVGAVFADAASDPRLSAAHSVFLQSIRASACVPLKPRDQVIGALYLDNLTTPSSLLEDDLEFLVAFASQVAIAVENASLYRRIEEETVSRMALVMEAKLTSLNALVAGVAHEIRNPLNFIANFAELSVELADEVTAGLAAQRERPDPRGLADLEGALGELRQNAARIDEHGRRADTIIKAMLLHARKDPGEREETPVNDLVAEGVKLAVAGSRDGAGAATEIALDLDVAAGSVDAVRGDLSRVLVNVIDNALYAMGDKRRRSGAPYAPRLSVRTASRGDRVEIRVSDNGPGIAPEIADRIYNPFFTTKPPREGIGLGLSLSRDIVVQGHQGTMQMASTPGEGCELTITLPRRGLPRPRPT